MTLRIVMLWGIGALLLTLVVGVIIELLEALRSAIIEWLERRFYE